MKKRVFFIEKCTKEKDFEEFKNILEIESREKKETEKIIINYYSNDRLEEEIFDLDEKTKMLRKIRRIDEVAITFCYTKEQAEYKRNFNIRNIDYEVLFEEILSIFDRRKMNKCFNYDLEKNEITNIASELIEHFYSQNKEKEKIREILEKTMEMDIIFFKGIKDSYNQISDLKEKIKSFLKNETKWGVKENTERIRRLENKYKYLYKEVAPKLVKEIKRKSIRNSTKKRTIIIDIDYSKIDFSFPKVTKKYLKDVENEEKIKKFYKKEVILFPRFQELILDEALGVLLEQEKKYLDYCLEGRFSGKIGANLKNGFYDYILEYDLYDKYKEKIQRLNSINYNKIAENIFKDIDKNLDYDVLEAIVNFSNIKYIEEIEKVQKLFEFILKNNKEPEENEEYFNLSERIYMKYSEKLINLIIEICNHKMKIDDFYDDIIGEDSIRELLSKEKCYSKIEDFELFYKFLKEGGYFKEILSKVNRERNSIKSILKNADVDKKLKKYYSDKTINFKEIIEYIYDPSECIDLITGRYADYEEIRLKNSIMEAYLIKRFEHLETGKKR